MNKSLFDSLDALAKKFLVPRRIKVLLGLFILFNQAAYGQDYSGIKFTSPAVIQSGQYKLGYVQIVANQSTCVRITMNNGAFDTLVFLNADSIIELDLNSFIPPYAGSYADSTPTDYLSLKILSNYPVNAYIKSAHTNFQERILSDDQSTSSLEVLNYKYYNPNIEGGTFRGSQMAILSLMDNTVLTCSSEINLGHQTYVIHNKLPVLKSGLDSIKLQKGEVLYLGHFDDYPDTYDKNLNGIKFTSANPFKVYILDVGGVGYDTSTQVSCGPFIERNESSFIFGFDLSLQEPAQNHFYCVPANGNGLDFVRALSLENSTEIFWNDTLVKTLSQGEFWDTCFQKGIEIRSSKPIQLGQYVQNTHIAPKHLETLSISTHGINSDDFFQDILFQVDSNLFAYTGRWYVNLISELLDTDKVIIQGAHQILSPWQAIGNSDKAWTKLALVPGHYRFQSDSKIAAFYYAIGFNQGQVPASIRNPKNSVSYKLQGLSLVKNHPLSKFRLKEREELQILRKSDTFYTCTDAAFQIICPKMGVSKWRFICSWGDTLYSQNELGLDTFSFSFPQIGNYFILIEDTVGCEEPMELFIRIDRAPPINWNYQIINNCDFKLLELQVDAHPLASYSWIVEDLTYTGAGLSIPIQSNQHQINVQLVQKFHSCYDTIKMNLNMDSLPETSPVPNVMTPNGDGLNDVLCFESIFSDYVSCFQINIANRWGQVIYQSSSINDCWRPENLSAGVYYYQIKLGAGMMKGFIHLQ